MGVFWRQLFVLGVALGGICNVDVLLFLSVDVVLMVGGVRFDWCLCFGHAVCGCGQEVLLMWLWHWV